MVALSSEIPLKGSHVFAGRVKGSNRTVVSANQQAGLDYIKSLHTNFYSLADMVSK